MGETDRTSNAHAVPAEIRQLIEDQRDLRHPLLVSGEVTERSAEDGYIVIDIEPSDEFKMGLEVGDSYQTSVIAAGRLNSNGRFSVGIDSKSEIVRSLTDQGGSLGAKSLPLIIRFSESDGTDPRIGVANLNLETMKVDPVTIEPSEETAPLWSEESMEEATPRTNAIAATAEQDFGCTTYVLAACETPVTVGVAGSRTQHFEWKRTYRQHATTRLRFTVRWDGGNCGTGSGTYQMSYSSGGSNTWSRSGSHGVGTFSLRKPSGRPRRTIGISAGDVVSHESQKMWDT